jgi:hypothetical protein
LTVFDMVCGHFQFILSTCTETITYHYHHTCDICNYKYLGNYPGYPHLIDHLNLDNSLIVENRSAVNPYGYMIKPLVVVTSIIKRYYFWIDGKCRILIVSFLGHIQVASKKKHRKAGGRAVIHYLMGWNGAVTMIDGRRFQRSLATPRPLVRHPT